MVALCECWESRDRNVSRLELNKIFFLRYILTKSSYYYLLQKKSKRNIDSRGKQVIERQIIGTKSFALPTYSKKSFIVTLLDF